MNISNSNAWKVALMPGVANEYVDKAKKMGLNLRTEGYFIGFFQEKLSMAIVGSFAMASLTYMNTQNLRNCKTKCGSFALMAPFTILSLSFTVLMTILVAKELFSTTSDFQKKYNKNILEIQKNAIEFQKMDKV